MSVLEMRRLADSFAPVINGNLPEVGAFHEAQPVRDGVTADVVVPIRHGRSKQPHPVLVYLHGGGWICGSARTHRKLGYRFAEAGYLVVNVNYRLAPEHPFPTPFEDCLAATRWAQREAARFGGDATRVAIGGDSVGANLAAAVAAELAGDPQQPKAALLLYGLFDIAMLGSESQAAREDPLVAAAARDTEKMMMDAYLGAARGDAVLRNPQVSPLHAAAKLPPCHIVVGGADPLTVQSAALAMALAAAGVAHEHFVDAGMPHGYAQMEYLGGAGPAIARMVAFLKRTL